MTGQPKKPRAFPWTGVAFLLSYGGILVMAVPLFAPAPRFLPLLGILLVATAVVPYVLALRRRLQVHAQRDDTVMQSFLDTQQALNTAHEAQMAQLRELGDQIEATSRAIRLPIVEAEVYAEILGLDPDQVAFMVWPDDGLRDSVTVHLVEGQRQGHRLTLDQMNLAAETINQRLTEPDREQEV